MSLFRLIAEPPPLRLNGHGLVLRSPVLADYEQWRNLRASSRNFLTPWEPQWADDDLEISSFRRRIARYDKERQNDQSYTLFLFSESQELLGGVTLSHIRRGISQCGIIGYWVGARHAKQGHMGKALPLVCAYAFATLRLERIEAAAQPDNHASLKLLRKCGFTEEGYARSYLRIAGQRRDHILFSLLPDDVKKSKTA